MSLHGERTSKRRRVAVKMKGFETVNELTQTTTGLCIQRMLLKPPAFMRVRGRDFVVNVPVAGGRSGSKWRPYTPVDFFTKNEHWARCLANLACICGAHELTLTNGALNTDKFRRSRVIAWIDKIRCLCHARDTRKLPNPTLMVRTAAAGDRRRKADDLLWHGSKLTQHTFLKMVADFKSQLDSRARACVFPYYPHVDTQTDIVENYKLCVLHSTTPGDASDAHMKLACMVEACCPHLFPSVPATDHAIGDELVEQAVAQFHSMAGLDSLARKFTLGGIALPSKLGSPGHRDTSLKMPLSGRAGLSQAPAL